MTHKPIKTYKAFFRALRTARRRGGYDFKLTSTCVRTPAMDRSGTVPAFFVRHHSPSTMIYSPFLVVWLHFFRRSTEPLQPVRMSAKSIGLPPGKERELRSAIDEKPGHSEALRRRLLKACGLDEVPHEDRPHKRKRKSWSKGTRNARKSRKPRKRRS
jgi:hypothetical protein